MSSAKANAIPIPTASVVSFALSVNALIQFWDAPAMASGDGDTAQWKLSLPLLQFNQASQPEMLETIIVGVIKQMIPQQLA